MSQGTLYYSEKTPRGSFPKALIDYLKIDVAAKTTDAPEFAANFPLKKIPAFIGPKGFKLTEVIAIILYFVSLSDPKSPLLGKNSQEYCQIIRWLSFINSDVISEITKAIIPLFPQSSVPYNKKAVDIANATSERYIDILEKRLADYTYLVSERVTLADLFVAAALTFPFTFIWGNEWLVAHPNISRWWKTVIHHPALEPIYGNFKPVEKPLEYVPPKKEKKQKQQQQQQPKKQEKKAEKPQAAVEPPQQTKKPKHPLEALGKSTIPLDEWKRVYSNEETREAALPYFWDKFFNPEEWSLWKVGYKYNDELTLTFMSNNLVGGFFNRLSGSTKFLFGCLVVYGENNDNGIVGAFLVRGQEFQPAFDVAPDWESYSYEKLDSSLPETKDFVNNMWAWDQPVVVADKNREIADGKVFK
ncbi:putative translation elongation factor 1-gamma [Ascoidea rubescens DSM 1968]|uniref:Putative translation elongation factor 1-gamma n=1 Tax=Ascoidea rubescens DSM 1968 TaxID=1344418 RepID=A0A1D2VRX2_9ASCO|nr:putative translation elongation factor 1-gamma [Ascoidea rubescens DSM 1968]ODV64372.1 putative translation elongation factor 1-gamma [Ascoidea rubescens DSM 1968]